MAELARNANVAQETLKNLWLSRLPPSVRGVLTVSQQETVKKLALMADKIMENLRSTGDVSEINTTPQEMAISQLAMTMEIKNLKDQASRRSRERNTRYDHRRRFRSRSRTPNTRRRTPNNPDWLCRYHYKFGTRANKCEQPYPNSLKKN